MIRNLHEAISAVLAREGHGGHRWSLTADGIVACDCGVRFELRVPRAGAVAA